MAQVLPPNEGRANNWKEAKLIPLKYQHSDGSVTAPDSFGRQVLPPSTSRAAQYAKALTENIKYLLPDGSVVDGGGPMEMLLDGGGGGATNYAGLNGKPQINGVMLQSGDNSLADMGIASAADVDALKRTTYEHTQSALAAVWNIQHNLGSRTVVALTVDSTGEQITGQIDVPASTMNLLVIRFSEPITGKAYIKI